MTNTGLICLIFTLLLPLHAMTQESAYARGTKHWSDSLIQRYPFLDLPANKISGDTLAMPDFYRKLIRIKNGSREQAVVVHIGDSHVQPGIMTRPLREWLQSEFGNAGRGLIFPYRLAKSNGPEGYITHADVPWSSGRNATEKRPLPTGIAGFTLWSASLAAAFSVEFTTPPCTPGDTALLTIFHENGDSCFFFSVSNEINGCTYPVVDSSAAFTTTYLLDDQPGRIRISLVRTKEAQKSATFYGMSLETAAPGAIVHTIGVNGAMFSSYLESEHFIEQLAMLHPDLLIFSLGTNESFDVKGYSTDSFRAGLDLIFQRIRRAGMNAAVILATPPGIYKSSRKKRHTYYTPNPVTGTVSEILRQYAMSNGMAVWDWYTIMGGKTGMSKWKAKKLTDRRYIHFTPKGYEIEGLLLNEAMRSGYEESNTPGARK